MVSGRLGPPPMNISKAQLFMTLGKMKFDDIWICEFLTYRGQ